MTPEVKALIAKGKQVDEQLKTLLWEIELLAAEKRGIFRRLSQEHGFSLRALSSEFGIHHSRVVHIISGRKLCKPHRTNKCKKCANKQVLER